MFWIGTNINEVRKGCTVRLSRWPDSRQEISNEIKIILVTVIRLFYGCVIFVVMSSENIKQRQNCKEKRHLLLSLVCVEEIDTNTDWFVER